MRTLKFTKSFADVSIDNVFVLSTDGMITNIENGLRSAIGNAVKKVCFVLENGMNDRIAQMLSETEVGKYILVPKIEEEKYQRLKNQIIAREVDNIKGNYAIIDSCQIFFFNDKFNGYVISDEDAASVVQQLFLKEFWENGELEFIEKKQPCAEVTFDVPPVYGNENVLIDASFSGGTEVESLISRAKKVAFTHKAEKIGDEIIIKNADLNSDFLKTVSNDNVILAKDLPCAFVSDGTATYILNFEVSKYRTLPEKGKGRLFAVRCGNLTVGKTYRFYKHKVLQGLVNKDVLAVNGEPLIVSETTEEQRKIIADLRMAEEYARMDEETLEARLEKKYPDIFKTNKYAASITYNIAVEIVKRSMNGLAEIYGKFDKAKGELRKKWGEVLSLAKELKLEKNIAQYQIDVDSITNRFAYNNALLKINEAVKLINNRGDEEVDEALSEVTSKKKRINLLPLTPMNLNMDIPANGKLYQNRDKYEYVLVSESVLSAAMEEMRAAGIDNINVLYLTE